MTGIRNNGRAGKTMCGVLLRLGGGELAAKKNRNLQNASFFSKALTGPEPAYLAKELSHFFPSSSSWMVFFFTHVGIIV